MRHTATLLAALMFAFIARAAETAPVPAPVVKPALPLRVIQPTERAIFQRNACGEGEVPVAAMIKDGQADTVEVRAINRATKLPVREWEKVIPGTKLTLPAGWYQLEFRAMKAGAVLATGTVERVGVGEVFVTCGQSNSANHGSPRQKAEDDRVSSCSFLKVRWQHGDDPQCGPSGTEGSPWALLGDLIAKQYDVPVGFFGVGVDSEDKIVKRAVISNQLSVKKGD